MESHCHTNHLIVHIRIRMPKEDTGKACSHALDSFAQAALASRQAHVGAAEADSQALEGHCC